MKTEYETPSTRLAEWKTTSGHEVPDELWAYFEIYSHLFLDALTEEGVDVDDDRSLGPLLQRLARYEYVGDFLSDPKTQIRELAGFGLISFDRLAALDWGRSDPFEAFVQHEQLCECYEYVRDKEKESTAARQRAAKRFSANSSAKAWVRSEWAAHSSAYDGNKSAFARDYVRRLRNERGVAITEKTMCEVWLRDTPDARIPAA